MQIRCGGCKNKFDIGEAKCPTCDESNPLIPIKPPAPTAPSPKQRRRNAARRQGGAAGAVSPQGRGPIKSGRSLLSPSQFPSSIRGVFRIEHHRHLLVTSMGTWKAHIVSDVPQNVLNEVSLEWRKVSVEGQTVFVEPVESEQLGRLRAHAQAAQRQFLLDKVGMRRVGTTVVDLEPNLLRKAAKLEQLAHAPNPSAWADVASGWHDERLRPAVLAALERIGWSKIRWLVHATDTWPDDLIACVEREWTRLNRDNTNRSTWHPNDYLLQDW